MPSPDKEKRAARQGPHARQLIRWQEITLAVAVAAACIGFLAVRGQNLRTGRVANVFLNGEQILAIPLGERDDHRVDLAEAHGVPVSFEVKDGAIRYVDVTCPDHICEQTGFVSAEGQTAVCMPNRVAVVIAAPVE